MSSITTIVFDFGNVLGHFSHRQATEQLRRFAPPEVTNESMVAFAFSHDLEPRFEVGELTGLEVLNMLRRQFHLTGTDDELAFAFSDMFTPNVPICDLVPRLQGRYRLMMLSNTNELHYAHFRRQFAEVLDRFDHLITSHEVRMRKPDSRIYRHAEELAGASPEQIVFIDDLTSNIEAARRCGWHGVVYRTGDDLPARLRELGIRPAD
jgi:putative hydrolase of the HAD superfamily